MFKRFNLQMQFLVNLLILVSLSNWHKVNAYSYRDQAAWYDSDDECRLDRQSPIELSSFESVTTFSIPPLKFNNFSSSYSLTPIMNNGHTANLQLPQENLASIQNGPLLTDTYITESLHFHWGSRDHHGAEHIVNSHRYSMEMHIVNRNSKYATVAEATTHEDGLAVLGVFYDAGGSQEFSGLTKIVNSLSSIREYNSSSTIENLSLRELFEGTETKEFFTYKGSLTTPPCSRAVTWIVFPKPIHISEDQINSFRMLIDDEGEALVNNYRFLQYKGNRHIYLRPNI